MSRAAEQRENPLTPHERVRLLGETFERIAAARRRCEWTSAVIADVMCVQRGLRPAGFVAAADDATLTALLEEWHAASNEAADCLTTMARLG